jgi:2-polyprenyl-3-methyl-5-hydroxy-6-metoxy-1,4-benzoquinol methylase
MDERAAEQEAEYAFPYHHLAHFDRAGSASRVRILQWAVEYLVYMKRAADLVVEAHPASVLDVGCGDGRFLGLLPDTIGRRVGADLSERAVSFARAFHPEIEFHARDAAELDETFDVVTAIEVLEHVPDAFTDGFLRTLAERTRPGGLVLIVVPTLHAPVPPKHHRHYDEALLRAEIEASGAPVTVERTEWILRSTPLLRAYNTATFNRFWFVEVWPLRKRIWRHAWENARHADATNGKHLLAVLRRAPS